MPRKFTVHAVQAAVSVAAKHGYDIPSNVLHEALLAGLDAEVEATFEAAQSVPGQDGGEACDRRPPLRAPRPGAWQDRAHKILGAYCACYADAHPASSCDRERDALADDLANWLSPTAAQFGNLHSALQAAKGWIADGGHVESGAQILNQINAALAAAPTTDDSNRLAPADPMDWKLTPATMTDEMVAFAVHNTNRNYGHDPVDAAIVREVYGAALHSRPPAPALPTPPEIEDARRERDERLLSSRDKFIVGKGLWQEFCAQLPKVSAPVGGESQPPRFKAIPFGGDRLYLAREVDAFSGSRQADPEETATPLFDLVTYYNERAYLADDVDAFFLSRQSAWGNTK